MPEAKKQRKLRRWTGKLAQKIRPRAIRRQGLAVIDDRIAMAKANEEMRALIQQDVESQRADKLDILAKHYGVERGDYRSLALRLAIDVVPGFQVDPAPLALMGGQVIYQQCKKRGRPIERTPEDLEQLIIDVENAKKIPEISTDEDALRHIAKKGKWARPPYRDLNKHIKSLKNALALRRRIQRDTSYWLKELEGLGANKTWARRPSHKI